MPRMAGFRTGEENNDNGLTSGDVEWFGVLSTGWMNAVGAMPAVRLR